jgi:hypothetical protein
MILVDISAWKALYDETEIGQNRHIRAEEWFAANQELLLTTNYIIDETITLFLVKNGYERAVRMGNRLWQEEVARIERITETDEVEAWRIFQRFNQDKGWSFTGCTSYVVMKRLGITVAFAFDRDFEQMPGIIRVP